MNEPVVQQAAVRDVEFGARVRIVEPCNLYGCKLGDDCFVGPFTEIQQGAVVGARTPDEIRADAGYVSRPIPEDLWAELAGLR